MYYPPHEVISMQELLRTMLPFFIMVCLIIVIPLYVLRSIGVMTLAKKSGVRHAWLAWIPVFSAWTLGKIAGHVPFGGAKMKRPEVWNLLLAIANLALGAALLSVWIPQIMELYYNGSAMSDAMLSEWMSSFMSRTLWGSLISVVLGILTLIFNVFLYQRIYKLYDARFATVYTVLTVLLGLDFAFLFAIRNRPRAEYAGFPGGNPPPPVSSVRPPFTGENPNPPQDPFGGGDNSDPFA